MGVWLWGLVCRLLGWGHCFGILGSICWRVDFTVSKQLQRWWERQKCTSWLGSPWKPGRASTGECRIMDYPNLMWSFFTTQPPWEFTVHSESVSQKNLSVCTPPQTNHTYAHIPTNTYYICTKARFCSPRTQVKQDSLLYRFFPDREFFYLSLNSQVTVEVSLSSFLNIPHTCGNTSKAYHVTTWEYRLNKKKISPHIMGAVMYTQRLPLPKAT